MAPTDQDIYDYLATSKVSEVTTAQLEQSLENSYINKSSIEFWKGAITVHKLLEVSRTYPLGAPIPEAGAVSSNPGDAGGTLNIQPPGTEIWNVVGMFGIGIGGTATVKLSYTDGTNYVLMRSGVSLPIAGSTFDMNEHFSSPVHLTNSLYFQFEETGTSNAIQIFVAYQVLSL
jgi:hypothetical protein